MSVVDVQLFMLDPFYETARERNATGGGKAATPFVFIAHLKVYVRVCVCVFLFGEKKRAHALVFALILPSSL